MECQELEWGNEGHLGHIHDTYPLGFDLILGADIHILQCGFHWISNNCDLELKEYFRICSYVVLSGIAFSMIRVSLWLWRDGYCTSKAVFHPSLRQPNFLWHFVQRALADFCWVTFHGQTGLLLPPSSLVLCLHIFWLFSLMGSMLVQSKQSTTERLVCIIFLYPCYSY